MKLSALSIIAAGALIVAGTLTFQTAQGTDPALATPGSAAPSFSLPAANGKTIDLSQYKGKYVVIEWLNHGCPFVKKQYDSGNMQALQEKYTEKGVIWLSIVSSAKGLQGNDTAEGHMKTCADLKAKPTAILMDEDGKVGKAYGAKSTPHMFIIDKEGKIAYNGAIDDKPTPNINDVKTARNYVAEGLDLLLAGKEVAVASTQPYGCGMKYAH